ncbi:DNA-binding transcriptional regulator, LysR family [Pseudoxanthobacter soli DSM 19599]|uniref:DNA-binding transcriptional regulator, LysR family n=1 Tax=Pseudoxanthobacter soli DSM 19599 TaxID=1123029 RepID=A0A1M7ZQM2_9HYPH|nr:LysR family transcriptional regulator [Pseudoxanthobacter soli]SHO66946.1 DNA-binding transcriptional regulator, LysR family [Pseudoxanthobacter soli DSM 19599]
MDLRQLRYFVTVAEERNVTRAAARLNIAQPPLSRQIQQLEAEIGAPLFDRAARPLQLTPIGRLVLEQASQVLGRVAEMREMVGRAVVAERRRFAIGFVASTIFARLPQIIRDFRASTHNLDLSLVELVTLEQISALKEGRIDVGFGRISFEDDAVRRIVLRQERLIAAIPAGHPLALKEGALSLQDFEGQPVVLYPRQPRPSYADQVLRLLHDHGVAVRIGHEARELQIAIGLVAAEEGIAIVPESVRTFQVEGVCYRDLVERPTSPIIMSVRVGDHSPEIALMAEVIARIYGTWGYDVPDAIRRMAP